MKILTTLAFCRVRMESIKKKVSIKQKNAYLTFLFQAIGPIKKAKVSIFVHTYQPFIERMGSIKKEKGKYFFILYLPILFL